MSTQTTQLQDKASEVLVNMIDITVKSMSDVVEFGKQQIPEVIHQLLMWKAIISIVDFLLPLFLTIFLIVWATTFWNKVPSQASRDNDGRAPWIADTFRGTDGALYARHWFRGYVSIVLALLFTLISILNFSLDWLQIWIAPKVYLIQYAADLIKG